MYIRVGMRFWQGVSTIKKKPGTGKTEFKKDVAGFLVFLAFMGICTLISRHIYESEMSRVTWVNGERRSLSREIKVDGVILQGQESAVHVEAGLRVATVRVMDGDPFAKGDPLFQVDVRHLEGIIAGREREIGELGRRQAESSAAAGRDRRGLGVELARAREDYDRAARDGDIAVYRADQDFLAAKADLERYAESVKGVEVLDDGQRERMWRLKRAYTDAERAAADAVRAKGDSLDAARRKIEDIELSMGAVTSPGTGAVRLDMEYQQARLGQLYGLVEAGGWVYALTAGNVTSTRVEAGGITPDGPCLLYAPDDGGRTVELKLDGEQSRLVTVGDEFHMQAKSMAGETVVDTVKVESLGARPQAQGWQSTARIKIGNPDVMAGQVAEFSMTKQSETYSLCIPVDALHDSGNMAYYVFILEERAGILGNEWHARRVGVQVRDRDGQFAAIDGGVVGGNTMIVLTSTKELSDGAAVRLPDGEGD
jgi:multidrug resistance efflux pump